MLLIGRKAIICGWVRRVTRRRGWRTAGVGFITSAAAEHTHVSSAFFAARGACCGCLMAAIRVVRYGLLEKTTGAATAVTTRTNARAKQKSRTAALTWPIGAHAVRCATASAPDRSLDAVVGASRGPKPPGASWDLSIPRSKSKPAERKTARNASKQTAPPHARTISPKKVARAALAPNSQALRGAERAAGARESGSRSYGGGVAPVHQ